MVVRPHPVLHFKIHVSAPAGNGKGDAVGTADVMIATREILQAASEAVQALRIGGWTIKEVVKARPILDDEVPLLTPQLKALFHKALHSDVAWEVTPEMPTRSTPASPAKSSATEAV